MKLKEWVIIVLGTWAAIDFCLVVLYLYMLRIIEIGG